MAKSKKVGKTKEPSGGMESSNTQIIPQPEQGIQNFNIETLIARGIDKRLSVEGMERLLAMRTQLKAEWAKEQYTKAMAAFQGECPTIQKTKPVHTNTGQLAYKYAPLESIVEQVKTLLHKHGFSYSTTMEVLPTGVTAVVKVTHIDGHSENSPMTVPLGNMTKIMSASQQTAAASTFAKRYAFCNAFGILTGDEDNDGATLPGNIKDEEHAPTPPAKTPTAPVAHKPATAEAAARILDGEIVNPPTPPAKPADSKVGTEYWNLKAKVAAAKDAPALAEVAKEIETAKQAKKLNDTDLTRLRADFQAKREKIGALV